MLITLTIILGVFIIACWNDDESEGELSHSQEDTMFHESY